MTFFELNFRKTLTLGVEAKFCEDSESGLGFKIGPTQPEVEKTAFWKFIADPAVKVIRCGAKMKDSVWSADPKLPSGASGY